MSYLWAAILVLVNAIWLAANLLGLPGNWLMVLGTALLAWFYWGSAGPGGHSMFSPALLAAVVALAFAGEVLEILAGSFGARRTGATRRGARGALVGGIVGGAAGVFLIPVPLVGPLIGAAAGAAAAALFLERTGGRTWQASLTAGAGAGAGRMLGTVLKLAVGAVIWLAVAIAAFWS